MRIGIIEKQLLKHEGLRLKPYHCPANKLTIGIGRNLEDRGITEQEAKFLLINDISSIHEKLNYILPFYKDLDDSRQEVLINMAFNLGVAGLLKFKKTLGFIQYTLFKEASQEMLDSRWARQVGNRAIELSNLMKG